MEKRVLESEQAKRVTRTALGKSKPQAEKKKPSERMERFSKRGGKVDPEPSEESDDDEEEPEEDGDEEPEEQPEE